MSEQPQSDPTGAAEEAIAVRASLEDFASAALEKTFNDIEKADPYSLEVAIEEFATTAGNTGAERAYRLLSVLCSLHLSVEDPAETWTPRWQGPEGRSYTASDFRGEQNEVLAKIVNRIGHPALRARVADIVWYNDRRQREASEIAIAAYCETVEKRLEGRYRSQFDDALESVSDATDWLHRAFQIFAGSNKRGSSPEPVRNSFEILYAWALTKSQYVSFTKIAGLGINYELTEWAKVAPDAESLATNRGGGDYPMAVQGVWDLATKGYKQLGDETGMRRCQERSVDETIRMRDQVGSSSARAYWTRKAIGELRATSGFKERIENLRSELREYQDASLDEFGEISLPLDLSKERQGTIELFEGLTLPSILLQFAIAATSPAMDTLRDQALESRKDSLFSSLFGASYSDREGKTVAESPAAAFDGEPNDDWFKEKSLQYLDIRRHQMVGGFIEPARRTAMTRFPLEERHFTPIAGMSPFVPPGYEHIFALGFTRFWQGDYTSAVYLLVPQLENSIRHVLRNANHDSSKIKNDLLQEDRSLSGLLERSKPEMARVFGKDIVNEIDLLFNYKLGPALRHEMAHGKVSAGICYHPTGVYACWLIYHLTCLPLVRYWSDHVAPAVEQEL